MNKVRIALALVLISFLAGGMLHSPPVPVRHAEVSAPSLFSPETVEELEEYYEEVAQPHFKPEFDPLLATWRDGLGLDKAVFSARGKPSVLIYGAPWLDMDEVREFAEVDWKVDLKAFKMIRAFLPSVESLDAILDIEGVSYIRADELRFPVIDEFERRIIEEEIGGERGPDMTEIKDVVGGYDAPATSYTGAGVVVGTVDTGCDFGHPALEDAFDTGTYDGTGFGLVLSNIHVNSTPVANETEWLAQGNRLSYFNDSKYYINMTLDFDVYVNYAASPGYSMQFYVNVYAGAWGIDNVTDFWEEYLWEDIEIPDPSNLAFAGANYSFGYVMQQRGFPSRVQPYAKLFAPILVWNGTDNEYHVAVDWEGTEAWNAFWTGGYYYESLDFNDTDDRQVVIDMIDNSFVDDIGEGAGVGYFDMANPIVAYDYNGDGTNDFSLGALSWCYDYAGYFDDETVFNGFRSDGDAFSLMFDYGTHGTAIAAHVAARDIGTVWYEPDHNETIDFEGIAPGADIMATKAVTAGTDIGAYLWVCGFDYNETSGEFYYTGNHMSDLVTNSWGWIIAPEASLNAYGWLWDMLSTPGYLHPSYPGVLQVFSAGNEGAGYMNVGPPGGAPGVLAVGASTSSHWLEYLYGPDQPFEGIASFSSRGPNSLGYVKPDVLAPGLAGYTANPWYAQYFQMYWDGPYWGWGEYYNTTLFSGTSQAAPITAGVAALVVEALGSSHPQAIKNIIQSTADDLGYDPAVQGWGRINAASACDFAANDAGMVGSNPESITNFGTDIDGVWTYWAEVLGVWPSFFNNPLEDAPNGTLVYYPTGVWDGTIYFGTLYPGETSTIHYSFYDNAADLYGTPDLTAVSSTDAYYMREAATYTFTDTTWSYNDTVMEDEQVYGFHNLRDAIGTSEYDTAVATYDYVTIGVGFNETEVAGAYPWMFLYDWTDDDPNDGMANLFNETAMEGDELSRLTSASDGSNTNIMQYAGFSGLAGNMTLVIHDPMFDEAGVTWWNTTGNDFLCTVIFWEEATDTNIAFTDGGTDNTFNITVTAPNDPGIHLGYAEVDGMRIPYGYSVRYNMTGAAGTVHTVFSDAGELEPYDTAVYGCVEEEPDDMDFRSFAIHCDYDTAAYLGVRVIWEQTGYDMYITVNVHNITAGGYESDRTEAVDLDPTDDVSATISMVPGEFDGWIFLHPVAMNGTLPLPAEYELELIWYEDLTDQDPVLTWTADDSAVPAVVALDSTLVGDHVLLNATFPAFNLANMPEFEVIETTIQFLSGLYVQRSGTLVVPDSSYDPFSMPIQENQFAWETVDGIVEGDEVRVICDFSNSDCDIMAWWADLDPAQRSYGNNLLEDQMATGAHPEIGSFVAGRDGSVIFGIFDYDLAVGTYDLTVDTRVGLDIVADGDMVTYDTYELLRNGSYDVRVEGITATNLWFYKEFGTIRFENFFSPEMGDVTVTGTGLEKTITWSATDRNAGDEHFFEVLLSSDGGTSFQLLRRNLTTTSFVWDSEGFLNQTYIVAVRVYDNDPNENPTALATGTYWLGLSDEAYSAEFLAGDVIYTPPTTTTPPVTTTPPPPPPGIDPLIIGLIAGIGAGVVVVLILFLVKRR